MNKLQNLGLFLDTHLYNTSWDYSGYVRAFPHELYDPQKDWNQTVITKINQISATILKDTVRGGANCIIISESLVEFFNTLEYVHINPIYYEDYYKLGTLAGRYDIFVVREISLSGEKIYVCRLYTIDNTIQSILDVERYIKVGVIKIDSATKLVD
jgi:hypothetical protein